MCVVALKLYCQNKTEDVLSEDIYTCTWSSYNCQVAEHITVKHSRPGVHTGQTCNISNIITALQHPPHPPPVRVFLAYTDFTSNQNESTVVHQSFAMCQVSWEEYTLVTMTDGGLLYEEVKHCKLHQYLPSFWYGSVKVPHNIVIGFFNFRRAASYFALVLRLFTWDPDYFSKREIFTLKAIRGYQPHSGLWRICRKISITVCKINSNFI